MNQRLGDRTRLLGTLASFFVAAPVHANPVDLFGYGARASSMGSAQTAASEDVGANYYNPGILASLEDVHIDIGYQFAQPQLLVSELDLGVDQARGMTAGLVVPGRVFGRRLAIGAALYLPDQQMTRTRTLSSQQPRFVVYDNRPQRLFLAANLSLQLAENLFVGGGLAYMSSTQGEVLLDGRIGFPNSDDSELALAMDVDLRAIRYAQMGAWYRAKPWLNIGLSYRDGFALTLDQVFIIQGDVGPDGGEPLVENGFFRLQTLSQDLFQPAQLTLGFDAQLTPSLAFALDVQWQHWSAFENPAARIDIELDIGQFNDLVDIPDAPPLPVAGFHDTVVPRLGLEWSAMQTRRSQVHLRGGYVYEPSPTPAQFAETNFIDNDKHTLSLGAGLTVRHFSQVFLRPLSIDLSLAMTLLEARVHSKISPADPVGEYRSSGRVLQASVSSHWRF
jgi:long-subunit fatty acid transport protein